MTPIKFPSDFDDLPDYESPRVTADIKYDCRDKRYLTHTCFLRIDNQPICYQQWTEDDDWGTSSGDPYPNTKDMWNGWVKLNK